MTKKQKKIFVNILTVSRLIGALLVPFVFVNSDIHIMMILLVILFMTDFMDGKLSRLWKVQTVGGSLLDPLGDKVLAISCILSMSYEHRTLLLIIILEMLIILVNIYRSIHGEKVTTSYVGKFKTWVLSVTLVFGAINIFYPTLLNDFLGFFKIHTTNFFVSSGLVSSLIVLTIASELATIIVYILESMRNRETKKRKKGKLKPIKEVLSRLFDETKFENDKDKSITEIIRY